MHLYERILRILDVLHLIYQLMYIVFRVRKKSESEKHLRGDEKNKILSCHECVQGCMCTCMRVCVRVTLASAAGGYRSS